MGLVLPYQYDEGEFPPDSFEDITAKNLRFIARAFGVSQGLRLLHGVVSSAGARVSGTDGWTVGKTGTGTYVVSFDRAFAAAPTVNVTPVTGQCNALATPSQIDVSTYNLGTSTAADHSFNFTVFL